jgi:uncharacterized protein
MEYLMTLRWSPYAVGVGIGVLSWLSFLVSKKPLASSTTFAKAGGMIERALVGEKTELRPYYRKIGLSVDWQWMLVVGIVIGSMISSLLSGDFHWQLVPSIWAEGFGDNAALRVVVSLIGGLFLGFGARWADGCTSGHGISGTLQLALSSWISAICFFVGGVLTAQLIFKFFG